MSGTAEMRLTPWLVPVPRLPPATERRLADLARRAPQARLAALLDSVPWWEEGWLAAIGRCADPAGRDRLRQSYHSLFKNPMNAAAACREAWTSGNRELAMRWLGELRHFDCSPRMLAMRAIREKERLEAEGQTRLAALYAAWPAGLPIFERRHFRPFAASVCAVMSMLGADMRPRDDWIYNLWHYGIDLPRRERELADPGAPAWPAISILMPVYNPDPRHLAEALDSVLAQRWPHWELCIADDASTDPRIWTLLEKYMAADRRIRAVRRAANGHIAAASNTALEMAAHDYCALLDQDDLLTGDALAFMARAIRENPEARLVFSDEDIILDDSGALHGVNFKNSRWDVELLAQQNFIGHLALFRTEQARSIGGFRAGLDGSQDHDLWLRYAGNCPAEHIVHVPRVLYHWRAHAGSTAAGIRNKSYALDSARKAVQDWLDGAWPGASAERAPDSLWLSVAYPVPCPMPEIDLVCAWPESDSPVDADGSAMRWLELWLEPWFRGTAGASATRLFLICRQASHEILNRRLAMSPRLCAHARLVPVPDGQSSAECLDYGSRLGDGEIIGFVGHGVAPANQDWRGELSACLRRPGIGAVGGKLAGSNGSLTHGGYLADASGLKAVLAGGPATHSQWFGWNMLTRTVDALDTLCLFTVRQTLEQAGGLLARMGDWAGQDYCLRIGEMGLKTIWRPQALFRMAADPPASPPPAAFTARWADRLKSFNSNLLFKNPNFVLNP